MIHTTIAATCLAIIAIVLICVVVSIENDRLLQQIADWLVKEGCRQTTSGAYSIYYDDICDQFEVTEEFLRKNHDKLLDYINCHDEVLSETWDELDFDKNRIGFDMNFGTYYCPNCDDEEFEIWEGYS